MFGWSGHGQLLARHTNTIACPMQYLMCSINQSINTHEYPMTVLIKVVNNSMTALLEILRVLLKSIDLVWNVNRTTGKEVRPWPGWPDQLLQPCST